MQYLMKEGPRTCCIILLFVLCPEMLQKLCQHGNTDNLFYSIFFTTRCQRHSCMALPPFMLSNFRIQLIWGKQLIATLNFSYIVNMHFHEDYKIKSPTLWGFACQSDDANMTRAVVGFLTLLPWIMYTGVLVHRNAATVGESRTRVHKLSVWHLSR